MGWVAMSMSSVIALRDVWKRYGAEYVLEGIDLEVKRGSVVCIRGRSGIGKTTLVKIAALLIPPDRGEVYLNNVRVEYRKRSRISELRLRYIGYVPQTFDLIESLTVRENIELPMIFLGIPKSERVKRVEALLKALELEDLGDRFPRELSGGQQQRVAIARALAKDPLLIVADEPFSNLDDYSVERVIQLFHSMARHGKAVIITTTNMYEDYGCSENYLLNRKLYPLNLTR